MDVFLPHYFKIVHIIVLIVVVIVVLSRLLLWLYTQSPQNIHRINSSEEGGINIKWGVTLARSR